MITVIPAGGLGAVCHTGLGGLVHRRHPGFPWGTFAVNVLGCFLLGAVTSAFSPMNPGALWMITTEFFGGFTAFSTTTLDAVELTRAGWGLASAGLVLGTAGSSLLVSLDGTVFASIL